MNALIVYHTKTGHTRRAGEDIAAGLEAAGASPALLAATEMEDWPLADAQIVVVGSPCHAGSCHIRGGLSGPIREALKRLEPAALSGKVAGAFAVNCSFGGSVTVAAIEAALRAAGAQLPEEGVVVRAGVPFSLWTGPMASNAARAELRRFGGALAAAAAAEARGVI